MVWYSLSEPTRRLLTNSWVATAIGAALFVLGESVLIWFKKDLMVHLPTPLRVVVIGVGFYTLRHRWKEWKSLRRRSLFAFVLRRLFAEFPGLNFKGLPREVALQRLEGFIDKVLLSFAQVLGEKQEIELNVMLPIDDGGIQKLAVAYTHPKGKAYDPAAKFEKGDGAAGTAWETGKIIFVPAVKYQHGIVVQLADEHNAPRLELEPNVYRAVQLEPYSSVLCVPVVTVTDVAGVLNVDCNRQNTLSTEDMEFASVAASLVAMAIDKFRAEAS